MGMGPGTILQHTTYLTCLDLKPIAFPCSRHGSGDVAPRGVFGGDACMRSSDLNSSSHVSLVSRPFLLPIKGPGEEAVSFASNS